MSDKAKMYMEYSLRVLPLIICLIIWTIVCGYNIVINNWGWSEIVFTYGFIFIWYAIGYYLIFVKRKF